MSLLLAAWIATTLAAALIAFVRAPRPVAALRPTSVLLLRPCAGAEPELQRTLNSLPVQGVHRLRVCFITAEPGDPAEPAIHAAVGALRARGLEAEHRLGPPLGPNRKLSQLVAGMNGAEEEVIFCADSDVDLEDLLLDAMVGPVQAGLAAAWAPPVEVQVLGWGDRLSRAVLGGSQHAFPLLCGIDPAGLVGKCFAARRDALEAIGGLAPLAHHLGEDMELSRRLRAAGLRVGPAAVRCRSRVAGRSARTVRERFSRWILVIRAQRPALLLSYPLLLAASPLQVVLGLVLGEPALVVFAGAGRLIIAALARTRSQLDRGPGALLVDAMVGDPLLLWAWLRALLSRSLSWRGQRMWVDGSGRLRADRA